MKNVRYLIAAFLLVGVTAFATTTTNSLKNNAYASNYARGYGNSFIFVEQGIEFAIFPDGQFDFNVNSYGPNFGVQANFRGGSVSFNTGYSYDAYVQYDDYGAVIQIENVPIYYDYYGRIIQAGSIYINYNNRGYVTNVGGLYIHYNRYNRYAYSSGYINAYNRYYIYRPWHDYYAVPHLSFRIALHRPYRQHYTPYRYTYYRPYRDNYRPNVSYSARRRGSVALNTNRSNRYRQSNSDAALTRGRRMASVDRTTRTRSKQLNNTGNRRITRNSDRQLNNTDNRRITRSNDRQINRREVTNSKPRVTNRGTNNVKPRTTQKRPRTVNRNNNSRPRVTSKPRTTSRPRVASTQTKRKTSTYKQRSPRSNNRSSQRVTKTTRSRSSASRPVQRKSTRRRN